MIFGKATNRKGQWVVHRSHWKVTEERQRVGWLSLVMGDLIGVRDMALKDCRDDVCQVTDVMRQNGVLFVRGVAEARTHGRFCSCD